jgi:hypothetical protein
MMTLKRILLPGARKKKQSNAIPYKNYKKRIGANQNKMTVSMRP